MEHFTQVLKLSTHWESPVKPHSRGIKLPFTTSGLLKNIRFSGLDLVWFRKLKLPEMQFLLIFFSSTDLEDSVVSTRGRSKQKSRSARIKASDHNCAGAYQK